MQIATSVRDLWCRIQVLDRGPGIPASALFGVGSSRALVTLDRWWQAGAEMPGLGVLVVLAAFGSGALIGSLVPGHG